MNIMLICQQLKPRCVELSQLALRDDGTSSSLKALIKSTTQLLNILQQKCQQTDGVFDERLADYVFFPLSQILRRKQKYTDSLSELTIKCLRLLLEYGWRNRIALDLAKQLLILLTFVAGGVPGQETTSAPEELAMDAYGALAALFRDIGKTPGGAASLVETDTVPALGHCVTVILDGIKDGPSAGVQLQALQALDAVWRCIRDPQALSTFLPGTISALTKALMPDTATRRSRRTIVTALESLEYVLVSILSDIRTRNIKDSGDSTSVPTASASETKTLTKSWLKATTAQIKLALSNVVRLRSHQSPEVRQALNRICLTILDECHDTMTESASLLVETCMTLSGVDADDSANRKTTLSDLATIHTDLGELIKSTVYNWVTSLPRVMQSNDETAKDTALGQLSKAHDLLTGLNLQSSILEDTLANSLRDSVTVMQELSPAQKGLQEAGFDLNSQVALTLATDSALTTNFQPVMMSQESQRKTRGQLLDLLANLGDEQSELRMASEMLEYARKASGPSLLSAYWLSAQLVRSASSRNQDLDEFFSAALTVSDDLEAVEQELFSYSQSILTNADERASDWHLQAIALEVVASTAQRLKSEFRTELVDTLYPIAQLLGSPNARLRQHAITCLNIVSQSCGYTNASDLIVDNVDYMVNAISLRLNTFDISPQAPQVLIMMIRLTGPSLLLYLDDVVGSIFAALDNFHGYQKLVEVLFAVLGEIVDVGSKSGQLQIADTPTISHRKTGPSVATIEELITTLEKKSKPTNKPLEHEPVPHKPWKSAKALLDEATIPPRDREPIQDEGNMEIEKPSPTSTYKMLTSIARLGQHYLTSSSPLLRSKLLGLVSTSCAALSHNEDQFLPLINDIWPVVISRLYDSEPFVFISAAEAVGEICKGGGDFLGTRIQSEWGSLMNLARRAKGKMEAEKKGSGGRGMYSQANRVWEAVVGLLVCVVGYVRIGDEMFDEVLELLGYLVVERRDVREVFEVVNADAVWLVLWRIGKAGKVRKTPNLEGHQFVSLEPLVT
jgi:hypothetical protein